MSVMVSLLAAMALAMPDVDIDGMSGAEWTRQQSLRGNRARRALEQHIEMRRQMRVPDLPPSDTQAILDKAEARREARRQKRLNCIVSTQS